MPDKSVHRSEICEFCSDFLGSKIKKQGALDRIAFSALSKGFREILVQMLVEAVHMLLERLLQQGFEIKAPPRADADAVKAVNEFMRARGA